MGADPPLDDWEKALNECFSEEQQGSIFDGLRTEDKLGHVVVADIWGSLHRPTAKKLKGALEERLPALKQGVGSSEDVQQVMQAVRSEWDSRDKETRKLLEPISKVCLDKLSETRCASKINKDDLQCVRDAFKTNLQVVDAQNDAFAKPEDFWNERYEVETAADYLKTVKGWVRTPRELEWNDARGHVLRSKGFAGNQLDFPISSSNDLILALRQYRRDLELGCFLGLEMKRGLTAKGLRQAEVEFYLWGGCSLFPFVQVITDMQTGGAAFYKTGNSASGHNIVKQYFQGMDSVREFVKGIILSIPDNAGKDGPGGMMIIPRQLENPTRKRRREDTPEPDAGGGGTGALGGAAS